jgi:hypothetical protein
VSFGVEADTPSESIVRDKSATVVLFLKKGFIELVSACNIAFHPRQEEFAAARFCKNAMPKTYI